MSWVVPLAIRRPNYLEKHNNEGTGMPIGKHGRSSDLVVNKIGV